MRPALFALALPLLAADPARFADPQRVTKLKSALPAIERLFETGHQRLGVPGSAWGVVIDGELVLVKTFGVRNAKSKDPVTADTAFRIASMTKSFTAASVLKLRDEGKLSLEDPVEKWIPEFKNYAYPTSDTAPIRIRQLISHGAGFPEDNPWGDRQLAVPDATLRKWVADGIPFSTAPDTAFEYSNYGFALAGQIVQKASGMPYRTYVETKILKPLGMAASSLEPSAIPAKVRATGHGRDGDNFVEIPSLAHGSFGAMGGLVTTVPDLAKWVAYQLSAFPPRDGDEAGPVRRSSLREMQRLQRQSNFVSERTRATSGGYGYGLGISIDCRFGHIVGHGGGLPGFGSYMMWLPEYGVGMVAMTNLTYQGPAGVLSEAFDLLTRTGGLEPRTLPPSPVLISMRDAIGKLWQHWDETELSKLAADNFFLDGTPAAWQKNMAAVQSMVGACQAPGEMEPENLLRGRFRMKCERGEVEASFTLTPTKPPKLQMWSFQPIGTPSDEIRAAAADFIAKPHEGVGSCRLGPVLGGDGKRQSRMRLDCERGKATVAFVTKPTGGIDASPLQRAPWGRCAP